MQTTCLPTIQDSQGTSLNTSGKVGQNNEVQNDQIWTWWVVGPEVQWGREPLTERGQADRQTDIWKHYPPVISQKQS